jgi:hypothetical protein
MVRRVGPVGVQDLRVHCPCFNEASQCCCCGVAYSKGYNQQGTKPLELGMCLVKGLWDFHHFVVDALVDLLEIAGPREQGQVMGAGDFLQIFEGRKVLPGATAQLVTVDTGARVVRIIQQPVTPIKLLQNLRRYHHADAQVTFSQGSSADVLLPCGAVQQLHPDLEGGPIMVLGSLMCHELRVGGHILVHAVDLLHNLTQAVGYLAGPDHGESQRQGG